MTLLDIDGNEVELARCKKIIRKTQYDVFAELDDGSWKHLGRFFYENSCDKYIRKILRTVAAFRHVEFGENFPIP